MGTQQTEPPRSPAESTEPETGNPKPNSGHTFFTRVHRAFTPLTQWSTQHRAEILCAAAFAIIVGWPIARVIDPPKSRPYKIYVVSGHDTNKETLDTYEASGQRMQLSIGNIPVQVEVEPRLENDSGDAAKAKAEELLSRNDALLVIAHLNSQFTESSVPAYFGARPQVPVIATVASADDLLKQCGEKCFVHGKFVPFLQLSPTNSEQGKWAITFATEKEKRRFAIVSDNDPTNKTYTDNLVLAYHNAIDQFNDDGPDQRATVVREFSVDSPPKEADLRDGSADCVLYAGRLGKVGTLLKKFSAPGKLPMVILSDSSVERSVSDGDLGNFRPVHFTYQTDAADYNSHTNVFGQDAVAIAAQLIRDLNNRGTDVAFRLKSLFGFETVEDARKNLVRVMEENARSRSSYEGMSDGSSRMIYTFKEYRRSNGMFHVWELKEPAIKAASEMVDVDGWHPPRAIQMQPATGRPPRPKSTLAARK